MNSTATPAEASDADGHAVPWWGEAVIYEIYPRSFADGDGVGDLDGDGAGRWRILWTVVVPVIRPTLSVLMVFFFIWTWNEFYIPVVLLNDQSAQTNPSALATLRGQHTVDMTVVNAGSFLSLIPTILFFLIFQRTLSNGVTAGAVK